MNAKIIVISPFMILFAHISIGQTNTFPASGNVGIGITSPAKKLDIAGSGINLQSTTYSGQNGIIFKNGSRFIYEFNYGNNGTVTTAGGNTFVGVNAGNFTMGSTATSAAHASYNTGVGSAVLNRNTTGYKNTAMGYAAFEYNTTGANNTAIGFEALINNTTGNNNTATGFETLLANTTGNYNTANGYAALLNNTTASYNTAAGYMALYENTTGANNTSTGFEALYKNSTGNNNTSSGYMALYENTSGTNNTATGFEALYKNSTGNNNTTTGYAALLYNTTGNSNVATGYQAGRYIANGTGFNTASSSSIFIGAGTRSLTAVDNNEIVIGYGATGAGSNSVVLGNTSVTKTLLQGNVGIGTSIPQSKLAVNGTVTATQIKVTQTGWPDYVFDSTHQLLTLSGMESFIKANHRLPGIQSAEEIEDKGLDLGDMQKKQMQKIEELTLFIIQQQHEIDSLKSLVLNKLLTNKNPKKD